jgi:hypothetical protein
MAADSESSPRIRAAKLYSSSGNLINEWEFSGRVQLSNEMGYGGVARFTSKSGEDVVLAGLGGALLSRGHLKSRCSKQTDPPWVTGAGR